MSDKELDKLFKDKLGQDLPPYNPAAWDKMEAMLDERAQRKMGYYWYSSAAIVAIGLLVGGLALFSPRTSQNLQPNPEQNISLQSEPAQAPELDATVPSESLSNFRESEKNQSEGEQISKTTAPDNTEPSNLPKPVQSTALASADEATEQLQQQAQLPASQSSEEVAEASFGSAPNLPYLGMRTLPSDRYAQAPIQQADITQDKSRKLNRPWGQYAHGFAAYNSFNFAANGGLGYGGGLGVSYRLSERWSLHSGLQITHKNSPGLTRVDDSTFYGFSRERVIQHTELKSTTFLEVPLAVRYQFAGRHSLQVGASVAYLLNSVQEREREHHAMEAMVSKTVKPKEESKMVQEWDFPFFLQYNYAFSPMLSIYSRMGVSSDNVAVQSERSVQFTDWRFGVEYAF